MIDQWNGPTAKIQIYRVGPRGITMDGDLVTTEEPLEIRINYYNGVVLEWERVGITMRTPGSDYELTAGFLFTEGIIRDQHAIQRISHCLERDVEQRYNIVNLYLKPGETIDLKLLTRNFYTTSSCGVCGKASLESLEIKDYSALSYSDGQVSSDVVRSLSTSMRKRQGLFRRTGGLHAAGLFELDGSLICLREDVGRHNAVDKVIGQGLLSKSLPFDQKILAVSGRTSFEIMQKALTAGVPMVVGVGAPSSLAVELAKKFHITLIGFANSDGFNIYCGEQRIIGVDREELG